MGYYSERIKGSNLQKFNYRVTYSVIGITSLIGCLFVLSPPGQRLYKLIKEGGLEESEWAKERKTMMIDKMYKNVPFETRAHAEDVDRKAPKYDI